MFAVSNSRKWNKQLEKKWSPFCIALVAEANAIGKRKNCINVLSIACRIS